MSLQLPATQFNGKVWILIVVALVFGGLGAFCLLLGPLFLFGIMKDARGQPATDAGVALSIFAVPFLLVTALAVFNVVARLRPMIRICREALVINSIGSSSLDNVPLIPGAIRIAWLLVSLQGFKQQLLLAPWQSLRNVQISGPPMARTLTIVGLIYRAPQGQPAASTPIANQITFAESSFEAPLDQVAASIHAYWRHADARKSLPNWNQ
jgi:hypothetical protein